MSPALNYKALLNATPTHLPSICPFTRPHVIISALSMHLPPVLWAWIRAPATHFLGARILTTLPLSIPPAAFSALPQHLPSPFSVIILSSQYLFQRGPIWIPTIARFYTVVGRSDPIFSPIEYRAIVGSDGSEVNVFDLPSSYDPRTTFLPTSNLNLEMYKLQSKVVRISCEYRTKFERTLNECLAIISRPSQDNRKTRFSSNKIGSDES